MTVDNPFSSNSHHRSFHSLGHHHHAAHKHGRSRRITIALLGAFAVAVTVELADMIPIKPSELQEVVVSNVMSFQDKASVGPKAPPAATAGGLRGRSKFARKKPDEHEKPSDLQSGGDTETESGEKQIQEIEDVAWTDGVMNDENTVGDPSASNGRVSNQALTDATKGLIEKVDKSLKLEVDESLKDAVEGGAFGRGKDVVAGETEGDAETEPEKASKDEVKIVGKIQAGDTNGLRKEDLVEEIEVKDENSTLAAKEIQPDSPDGLRKAHLVEVTEESSSVPDGETNGKADLTEGESKEQPTSKDNGSGGEEPYTTESSAHKVASQEPPKVDENHEGSQADVQSS